MHDWKNLGLAESWGIVSNRDPEIFSWGYLSQDNMPMGGPSTFLWFKSDDEMLDFIVNKETELWSYEDEKKHVELQNAVKEILKDVAFNNCLDDQIRKKINKILSKRENRDGVNYFGGEIVWWGKFSDLCSGKDKFSKELVGDFFENTIDEGLGGKKPIAIKTEYVAAFIEFLKEYGIP